MTKFNCIYGLLAVLFSSIAFGQLDSLEGQRLAPDNESVLFETSISYAIARQGQRAVDSSALVRGFAETSTHVYSLSSKLQVVQTRVEGRVAERHWPLTRWFHEFLEPEYLERLSRQYENPKDRLLIVNPNAIGCLSAAPLRYGSIDATGKDYLVLHLSNDFLLFSPDVGKVVFGANIRLADWMTRSGTITFYEDEEGVLQESEGDPQYASNIAAVSVRGGALPPRERGYRGYGKLYFGDFNNDENADILLWRKLYISRLVGDETEGFEHLGDTLIHYQLIDGEYQPQDTDEATIKGWLSANELTWQKGYPNKSECEGVEGELIPEMHDPLLNDPDVLQ